MSDPKMEERVDKLEDALSGIVVVQTEQNVILKNLLKFMEEEKSNSTRLALLEHNWKWLKWIIGSMWLPLGFLMIRYIMTL